MRSKEYTTEQVFIKVEKSSEARMIRSAEHGEVKITAKEEREHNSKKFRQTVELFFIQTKVAGTGGAQTQKTINRTVLRGEADKKIPS